METLRGCCSLTLPREEWENSFKNRLAVAEEHRQWYLKGSVSVIIGEGLAMHRDGSAHKTLVPAYRTDIDCIWQEPSEACPAVLTCSLDLMKQSVGTILAVRPEFLASL